MKYFWIVWYSIFPSVNIRVFYRAVNTPLGDCNFRRIMAETAFKECSRRERDYLIWHSPFLRVLEPGFKDELLSKGLARLKRAKEDGFELDPSKVADSVFKKELLDE